MLQLIQISHAVIQAEPKKMAHEGGWFRSMPAEPAGAAACKRVQLF